MDGSAVESTLLACERSLAGAGRVDLSALGFWRAVASVKRRPELVDRYADRIARIDREAFVRGVRPLVFPASVGVGVLSVGTIVGIALVLSVPSLPFELGGIPSVHAWAYLIGAGILIGTTHGLAHWVVGTIVGIRFTHWYTRPPTSPQPGFKTDYASYLRAPARSRAWMHASGAIVTKVVPFLIAYRALTGSTEKWAIYVLIAVGVFQLLTDLAFSTRASDWKKFRREMRFA